MHQTFIFGNTKTGKSTLAKKLCRGSEIIYEAGSWAREEFGPYFNDKPVNEMDVEYRKALTEFALERLRVHPSYSFDMYLEFLYVKKPEHVIIVGVRNPDDFFEMSKISYENAFYFIESSKPELDKFDSGLKIIFDYLQWKKDLGFQMNINVIKEEDINE